MESSDINEPRRKMGDVMGSLAGTIEYAADDLFEDGGWADEWEMNQGGTHD